MVLRVFVGVEKLAADERGVDVVSIRSAVFVGAVKGGVFLFFYCLVVEVYASAGGAFGMGLQCACAD